MNDTVEVIDDLTPLPDEVMEALFLWLDLRSLLNLKQANRRLSHLISAKHLRKWLDIASCDDHSFFLMDGQVFALGKSYPTLTCMTFARQTVIRQVIAGYNHTFYKDIKGHYYVNGSNRSGQFGNGQSSSDLQQQPSLVTFPNGQLITHIVAGYYTSFFRIDDGQWYGCGNNRWGRLGLPEMKPDDEYHLPTLLPNPDNQTISTIACGYHHTIMQTYDGRWYGCGPKWALGLPSAKGLIIDSPTLLTLPNQRQIAQIVVGWTSTFIQEKNDDYQWYGCGYNHNGQLGISRFYNQDHHITTFTSINLPNQQITQIIPQKGHTFFITANDQCWVAGQGEFNQLGLGRATNDTTIYDLPVKTALPQGISQWVGSGHHTFYLAADYQWYGFGNNQARRLSLPNNTISQVTPALIRWGQFKSIEHQPYSSQQASKVCVKS